jgi:hypothetical protein
LPVPSVQARLLRSRRPAQILGPRRSSSPLRIPLGLLSGHARLVGLTGTAARHKMDGGATGVQIGTAAHSQGSRANGMTTAAPNVANAAVVALAFVTALRNYETRRGVLPTLVTPESLPEWGDFWRPARYVRGLGDLAVGKQASRAEGAPDVAYGTVRREGDAAPVAIVTLVWRPEYGKWLVHAFGDDPVPANVVPRTPR